MRNSLVLFPSGLKSFSRRIAPYSFDKVYVKGHNKLAYVLYYNTLRTEQRSWALEKYKEPQFNDAWSMTLEAKNIINQQSEKFNNIKRKPTWYELWSIDELIILRTLALNWLLTNFTDLKHKYVFLINDFMSQGITESEERVWFTCPDCSIPAFTIEYQGSIQTTGNLWIDENWEEAAECFIARNSAKHTETDELSLIQLMWRFIPKDIDLFCAETQPSIFAVANDNNLATIEEVIKREEQLQHTIAATKISCNRNVDMV